MRVNPLIPIFLLASNGLFAQSADHGGIGDPATAPGNPRSSYALGRIDHVNYYSGSVNFTIPLATFGGRGSVARPIVLPIQTQWSAFTADGITYNPETATGNVMGGFYSGGDISMVTSGKQPYACYSSDKGYQDLGPYTTYIVWESYDRTRTILTDAATNGQPQGAGATCAQVQAGQTPSRGRVFRSTDGSNLLFLAGHDIIDGNYSNVTDGTLIFPDGTKYRFGPSDPYVSSIEDRNGNLINYTFQGTADGGIYTVTDPLNRTSTINFTESLATNVQDVITVPGAGGSRHQITVRYALLANALAPGESLQTYHSLFPELNGSSSTPFNPYVIASVNLPDGTAYSLQYNSYGEVAHLQLPTGGVYTYRYLEANGAANGNSGVLALANNSGYRIYRRLQERDEYTDGVHLSAKTIFPAPAESAANGDPNHPGRPTVRVEADFEDAAGNLLRKETHSFYGSPGSTQPLPTDPTQYASWRQGLEFRTEVSDNNGAYQRQEQVWAQRPCNGESCVADPQSDGSPTHDPRVCQSNRILENGLNTATLFAYDDQRPYNNISDKYEYDYGAGPSAAPSCAGAPNGWTRHTAMTYMGDPYTSSTVHLVGLPFEMRVFDGSTVQQKAYTLRWYDEVGGFHQLSDTPGIPQHDGAYGPGYTVRGNLTTVWRSTDGSNNLDNLTQYNYDIAGNLVKQRDPNGNVTQYSYNDDGANLYAFLTSRTNALGHITKWRYDYGAGKLVSVTDPNGATTTYAYNDPLDRVTQIVQAGTQTNYQYPNATTMIRFGDQYTSGDQALQTQTYSDGLGHTIEQRTVESSTVYTATHTNYDALGRVAAVSNPYRPGDPVLWTNYIYDALGRTRQVQQADTAAVNTGYSGAITTVTDEAGKVKQYTYDGLGRLFNVREDPNGLNYSTDYRYDALDNLMLVSQGYCPNCQQRYFSYDGLSRLKSTQNPESGTMRYDYDANGNLWHKTDGRNFTTTYGYDSLNRLVSKLYSDGTPNVSYTYDTGNAPNTNSTGHLTQVASPVSTTQYRAFDSFGHVTASTQNTSGQLYNFSYAYNLAGDPVRETYPSGRTVTTDYESGNRPWRVHGGLPGQPETSYVPQVWYAAHGAPSYISYGNHVVRRAFFNNRLQPKALWDTINDDGNQFLFIQNPICWGSDNDPNCDAAGNNGNLVGELLFEGGPAPYYNLSTFKRHYAYDGANRLQTVWEENGWSRSYSYDPYGNQWLAGASGLNPSPLTPQSGGNFDPATNRLQGVPYDGAGNQKQVGAVQLQYDAENRQLTSFDAGSQQGTTYVYDGQGQRVAKLYTDNQGHETARRVYVYDAFGQLAAEYQSQAASASPCTTCYLSRDSLGSLRLVTDAQTRVIARHDFLPYGEEIWGGQAGRDASFGAADHLSPRFTGQERDGETTPNLDFFQARYYSAEQGRFLSPDPANAGADLYNPQSWHAYSYAWNSPLSNTDPSGDACVYDGNGDINDPGSYYNDDSSGQDCSEAFGQPTPPSTTTSTSVPYDFGEQAFVGFFDLFFNNKSSGILDLAQGLLELHPSNLGYSAAAHLCSNCGNAALALAAIRGNRGGIASVLKGKIGVQKAIADIQAAGGTVLGQEVKIQTSLGAIRADVVYLDAQGDLVIGEVKNGPFASYNNNQLLHGYSTGGPINGTVVGLNGGPTLAPGTPIINAPVVTYKY